MEVVYFFCENAQVRVPLFDYDKRLFNLLVSKGGSWDKVQRQFVFRREASQFKVIPPEYPCVIIEENTSAPIRIFSFFGRPWEQNFNVGPAKRESPSPPLAEVPRYNPPALPEKFSEYWKIKLETELRSRKYSKRTQRIYLFFNRLLCKIIQKSPEKINPDDIRQFLALMEKERGYSASSMNLAISSIRFFYGEVLKINIVNEQRRPRQDKNLPMVLSKTEINTILNNENNIKHRLLLTLAYSSGLRVSEVVSLKKEHIDLSRGVIYVNLGKGRKDRCTILSQKAVFLIKQYLACNEIQTWIFPGQKPAKPLSIRSAQNIFYKAIHQAKIQKEVSIHSLRHTFATHLLESGIDIRYIQALLGHSSLRTTERYTHIAKGSILNVQSPLDSIY